MKEKYRAWTTDERETLRRMSAEGRSIKEVAYALGRPYATASRYMRSVPHPPYRATVDQIRELAESGMSAPRIAERLGVTRVAIYYRCKKYGINLPYGGKGKRRK